MPRPKKTKIEHPEPELTPVLPSEIQDRMLRYAGRITCPECDSWPVVCEQKRGKFAAYRCRVCDHRWQVGG